MPLRHTLLGLLDWEPMHGYKLRQHAREYSWIYPMTNANIYPALHSLEQDGFVTHETEIFNGRARKTYQITQEGRRELGRWLVEHTDQDLTFRDQMLLKLSMLSDQALAGARIWIEDNLDRIRRQIEEYEVSLKEDREDRSRFTAMTMQHGLDVLRLRMGLLERVLQEALIAET